MEAHVGIVKLISKIEIDHFRSIQTNNIDDLGDFTAFAGPNNSGKSNVLRGLNAFFKDQTDSDTKVAFHQDYYRHDLKTKKAKQFSVTIRFDLPMSFKFRRGLEPVEDFLGRSFTIRKVWTRAVLAPRYFLNDSGTPLDHEKRGQVEQFLSLISFRYIPNRVLPLDIIRNEHQALRDVLVRRIAKSAHKQEAVFQAIEKTSEALIQSLQSAVHEACPDVGAIRLATPLSWQDLIFAFGYKLRMKDSELDDIAQGSGIQSLLMLETLSLIDRDYFQKFGWRQAAIWAVEEPESSLHTSLEAKVAAYLAKIAMGAESRLQVFCTTHSDLMLQNTDRSFFVTMSDGKSIFEACDRKAVLEKAARLGISRWTHPILHYPLHPIVLVEGKYDHAFMHQAFKMLAPQKTLHVTYLELLHGGSITGGIDEMLKYIKANISAIKCRGAEAPVVALLDWDSAKKEQEFRKIFSDGDPFKVAVWPETACNPRLGKSFHGIERHLPDRIIDSADAEIQVIGVKADGTKTVSKDDYGKLKERAFQIIQQGVTAEDLVHVKAFVQELNNLIP